MEGHERAEKTRQKNRVIQFIQKKKRENHTEDNGRDAPSPGVPWEQHAGTWETLTVKCVPSDRARKLMIPDWADARLLEVHFLLIHTKWLPGIIFQATVIFLIFRVKMYKSMLCIINL